MNDMAERRAPWADHEHASLIGRLVDNLRRMEGPGNARCCSDIEFASHENACVRPTRGERKTGGDEMISWADVKISRSTGPSGRGDHRVRHIPGRSALCELEPQVRGELSTQGRMSRHWGCQHQKPKT